MIHDALRPSGGRRVLGPHITGHGEYGAAVAVGEVTHHPDVPAVAEPPGAPERTAKGIVDRQAEREQKGPGPIVGAGAITRAGEQRSQNTLGHVVATRGELVEHQMLAGHVCALLIGVLLDVVE
jgi:hypothetical protein